MHNLLFLLGAADVEMMSVATGLDRLGIAYKMATFGGQLVLASQAYKADGLTIEDVTGKVLVTVECSDALGIQSCATRVALDHHNAGDPGYGKPPEMYREASSIGQVISYLSGLGVDGDALAAAFPNWEMVAAGDHCPAAAFLGKCPGIEVERFREFRLLGAATFQKMDVEVLRAEILAAIDKLMALPVITHKGVSWRDSIGAEIKQLNHATSWTAIPCAYSMAQRDGRTKVGIIGSDEPAVVSAWMEYYSDKLVDMYGDPARGFAGGYLPAPSTASG
jgi:hypothetical protein